MTPAVPTPLLATAQSLAVDRTTVEAVEAFRAAGVPSLLLKGPALATWLYPEGEVRPYVDADLLVPPDGQETAIGVLAELGYERTPDPTDQPTLGGHHAQPFGRGRDGAKVDLHRAPSGASVAPAVAWRVMSAGSEEIAIGGGTVQIPNEAARALIVAFHAAQHGPDAPKPLADLARAVERVPLEVWQRAAALAVELDGTPALAVGLRLLDRGRTLAARLELGSPELMHSALGQGSNARLTLGFERLARTSGLWAKGRLLRDELVPPSDFLRWWTPLARRGPAGLLAARVWRVLWLVGHALPSLTVWLRERSMRQAQPGPLSPLARGLLALEVVGAYRRARRALRDDDIRVALERLRPARAGQESGSDEVMAIGYRLGRAVMRTLAHLPGDSRCLTQSLTLTLLLDRRGIASTVVIGVRPGGEFSAHAWVEVAGRPLLPTHGREFQRLTSL